MKIVINSQHESAGSKVCVTDLTPLLRQAGHEVTLNDWHHYYLYDLALFMSSDADPRYAKSINPRLKCGLMVPMIDFPRLRAHVQAADFLLVGSLEARDKLLNYNPNTFIYYHFPALRPLAKKHQAKKPIIIGYHGNIQHLLSFHPAINQALQQLSRELPLELWAIYSLKKFGRWSRHLPRHLKIRHIQWHPDVYHQELSACDIGLVNNITWQNNGWRHLVSLPLHRYLKWQVLPFRAHDTLVRFKYSTNPGRIYPFAQLGIPVIADFAPSMSQIITDGYSGLIAHSAAGWYHALYRLSHSAALRQTLADNLRRHIDQNLSIDQNFAKLNTFLLQQVKDRGRSKLFVG